MPYPISLDAPVTPVSSAWRVDRSAASAHALEPEPMSDDVLIEQSRRGDQRAFRRLVERHEAAVASTVIGMLGPGADADDVGQETFIRLFRSLDRYRGQASLRTYLTRIAINLCLDVLRRRQRGRLRFWRETDDPSAPLPEPLTHEDRHDPDVEDRRRAVRRAILTLGAKQRAVVVLRMIEGLSTKETARTLGIPVGTVLSRLARAQDKLRQVLQSWIDES